MRNQNVQQTGEAVQVLLLRKLGRTGLKVAALCLGLEGPSVENVRADLLRRLGAPPAEPVPASPGDEERKSGLLAPSEPGAD